MARVPHSPEAQPKAFGIEYDEKASYEGNKNMSFVRIGLATIVTELIILPALVGQDPLPPQKLQPILALIKPEPGEDAWEKIPWRTDLWQARRQAAEQGKPILLWEMDGHPLGCT
jgi:hypothetical protein